MEYLISVKSVLLNIYSIVCMMIIMSLSSLYSQVCDVGNMNIYNQQQLNDFVQTIQGCEVLEGNLNLYSISDLGGLMGVKEVRGNFMINGTDLINFNGLDSLKRVEGIFGLSNLYNVVDYNELNNLKYAYLLNLATYSNATTYQGFNQLDSIGDGGLFLNIENNILALDGFEGLQYVGGEIRINGNDLIEELDQFNSLRSAGGVLIVEFPNLKNLDGFNNLEILNGDFRILSNPNLESINLQCSFDTINGSLIIQSNTSLLEVEGLDDLVYIEEDFIIEDNPELRELPDFQNLQRIRRDLTISDLNFYASV